MVYAYKGVASALDTLLGQLNALAPKRSKKSDGALGDQAHAARVSFHNPNSAGIVQARDFTHDPSGGLDCNWLAAALTASGDNRIHEIIWNRRYWTPAGGWVPYYGSNPHDKHLHLTVRSDPRLYNSTAPWDLSAAPGKAKSPTSEEDDMTPEQAQQLADLHDWVKGEPDWPNNILQAILDDTGDIQRRVLPVGANIDSFQDLQMRVGWVLALLAKPADLSAVPTGDLRAIAQAVNDEADRRQRDGDPATGSVS